MAEKLRVRLKSADAQPLSATIPVPAVVQGGGGSNIYVSDTPKKNGRDAFSTGGAYNLQQQINGKANIDDIPEMPEIPTVPTKLSELENDSGFVSATELEGMNLISEESLDGKGFVTAEQVNTALNETTTAFGQILNKEFVSNTKLEQKGYLTSNDVDNAIKQKGFVTETALNNKGFLTDEDIQGKNFVTGTALTNTLLNYAKTKDIPSVNGLASESYVNSIVGNINQVLDMINGEVV